MANRLSPKLIEKISKKINKTPQYIREQISRKAQKNNISSEAALILWAKTLGIGYATYLRSLHDHVKNEVSSHNISEKTHTTIEKTKVIVKEKESSKAQKKWHEEWWFKDLILPLFVVAIFGGVIALIVGTFILVRLGILH